MLRIVALNPADEAKFLADHPYWTMERRVQDGEGIVWGLFRVDVAAERKAMRTLLIATRAIACVLRASDTNMTFRNRRHFRHQAILLGLGNRG